MSKKKNKTKMSKEEIMYVEGKLVYEGDTLLFKGEDGQYVRKVCQQHKILSKITPGWVGLWSWNFKPKQR